MNVLPLSVAAGGGLESDCVERIYHYTTESVFAHRGITVNTWYEEGVGFLRQITVIRFGSFPRSVTDRYAGENGLWGLLEQRCIVWKDFISLLFIRVCNCCFGILVMPCTKSLQTSGSRGRPAQTKLARE